MMYRDQKQKGAGLVEIMVSVVVATTSVLGIMELQMVMQSQHTESYQKAQAMMMLDSMVDNLISNRDVAQCYVITVAGSGAPYAGVGNSTTFACTGVGNTSTRAIADRDLAIWDSLLKGNSETLGSSSVGGVIGARGCITYDVTADLYSLSISWQGLEDTVVNSDLCATGLYGSDAKRRNVSIDIRLSDWS